MKIKKIGKNGNIGKSNTQKKKGYTEDETEKDFLDSKLTKDKTIGNNGVIVIDYDERNEAVASLPTTENIMKHETLNDAKAPEENNEVVSALTTDIMKHEVDEAAVRKDVAGGDDVTGDMEVVEAGDAEGNEAVKDLLKGESNVSGQEDKPTTELIPDDTEILDKGGGRKEKTVWMAGEGDYLI